ncbi:MAG: magnesium/cobalt transporter CorA [Cyclobacteriaceae bacterium]
MGLNDLTRPDKLILDGLRSLGGLTSNLYTDRKKDAKAKGELKFIGEKKTDKVQSQLFEYNSEHCEKRSSNKQFSFIDDPDSAKYYWLNFHGIHNVELFKKLGEAAKLDRLTLRKVLDTTQRPKVEQHEHYLFFCSKSILRNPDGTLKVEQISFILSQQYIISFQEEKGDHFDDIRNRLTENLGFIRKRGVDYLLTQLLDAILENYFETIDEINNHILKVEKEVYDNPTRDTLVTLESIKRTSQIIKKSLTPLKEGLHNLNRREINLIRPEIRKFFEDLNHLTMQAMDEIDSTLKTLEGISNIYFASLSHRMNETMKTLTTVATIFIPLTFIAGIYGMNFENMPELSHPYGYPAAWGLMVLMAIGMGIYFKRKKWM